MNLIFIPINIYIKILMKGLDPYGQVRGNMGKQRGKLWVSTETGTVLPFLRDRIDPIVVDNVSEKDILGLL